MRYSTKCTVNPSGIPHFVNSYGTSLHLHNVEPTMFDFADDNWYSIRTPCNELRGTFLSGDSLLHACELHTSSVGRTRPLPGWTQRNGMLAGMGGGTTAVRRTCRVLFKYKVAVAGVLIRDWTGVKRDTSASNSVGGGGGGGKGGGNVVSNSSNRSAGNNSSWYNWVLEREHYPHWQPFVDSLERRGVSVGLYLCPQLEEIPMHLRSGRRYLFGEVGEDYFMKRRVMNEAGAGKKKSGKGKTNRKDGKDNANSKDGSSDGHTTTTLKMYNNFKRSKCGTLDPTNHGATSWFKNVVREEIFEYASASFWLADSSNNGMANPPLDALYSAPSPNRQVATTTTTSVASSSSSMGASSEAKGGISFHNSYAERWARVNREAISEAGRDGDAFFILNSAYGSAARDAGCTSLGDRVPSFRSDDGDILRAVLNGIVNGGVSGLTHGHCAVCLAVPNRTAGRIATSIDAKSREMICRWLELTAFTAVFRTHDGDSRCAGDGGGGGGSGGGGGMGGGHSGGEAA